MDQDKGNPADKRPWREEEQAPRDEDEREAPAWPGKAGGTIPPPD